MLTTRVRCAGLLIENDSLLLMRYADLDVGDIWQYPGGGLEPGETISEGVRREMREETGLTVGADRMGYVLQLFTDEQSDLILYFWVTRLSGELGVDVEYEPTRTEMRFVHAMSRWMRRFSTQTCGGGCGLTPILVRWT